MQSFNQFVDGIIFHPERKKAPAHYSCETRGHDVETDALDEKQAFGLAVLGTSPSPNAILRRGDPVTTGFRV